MNPNKAKTEEHGTPDYIFKPFDDQLHFKCDAAASDENSLVKECYYTKENSGLVNPWRNPTWCNPPYNVKDITAFIDKALKESTKGVTTVMLLPVKTDQQWWHTLWQYYTDYQKSSQASFHIEIQWIKGRVKYKGNNNSARFPSVIVIIKGGIW